MNVKNQKNRTFCVYINAVANNIIYIYNIIFIAQFLKPNIN